VAAAPVYLVNNTFVDNLAYARGWGAGPVYASGGAANLVDNTRVEVLQSLFWRNRGLTLMYSSAAGGVTRGGACDTTRSAVHLNGTVFWNNTAEMGGSAFSSASLAAGGGLYSSGSLRTSGGTSFRGNTAKGVLK
jgi:hypothetical protein